MEQKLDFDELEMLAEARLQTTASKSHEKFNENTLICECMCLTLGDIRDFIDGKSEISLKTMTEELGLGSGCSNCLKSFKQWKEKV